MCRNLLSYQQGEETRGMDATLSQGEGCAGRVLSVTRHSKPCINTGDPSDELLLMQKIHIFPEPHLKQRGGERT